MHRLTACAGQPQTMHRLTACAGQPQTMQTRVEDCAKTYHEAPLQSFLSYNIFDVFMFYEKDCNLRTI